MKKGVLLIAGAYFIDDRIKFFDHPLHDASRFHVMKIDFKSQVRSKKRIKIPEADFACIFGLKTLGRRGRKARMKPKVIQSLIFDFFKKNIGSKIPLCVLDDFNLGDEKKYGDFLRKSFLSEMNCKSFLLREYLKGKKYDKRVLPFSIPCVDYSAFAKAYDEKPWDLQFRGNASSSKSRNKIIKEVGKFGYKNRFYTYKGGERSGKKIPFEKYMNEMASSKVCLTFDGAGYCCSRYQEIPSCGSILACPEYPFVVVRDYKDMESCIKYKSSGELKDKLKRVLGSKQAVVDMSAKSLENFKKYHTNVARYQMFLEAIDRL